MLLLLYCQALRHNDLWPKSPHQSHLRFHAQKPRFVPQLSMMQPHSIITPHNPIRGPAQSVPNGAQKYKRVEISWRLSGRGNWNRYCEVSAHDTCGHVYTSLLCEKLKTQKDYSNFRPASRKKSSDVSAKMWVSQTYDVLLFTLCRAPVVALEKNNQQLPFILTDCTVALVLSW